MRTILVPLAALALACPPGVWAASEPPGTVKPPAPASALPPASAAPVTPSSGPSLEANIDELPWNPDVLHANVWPYQKPLKIDSGYFGPPGEFWLRGDYLLWTMKSARLPPLVSAGPPGSNGVLGGQGVAVLFGGSTVDPGAFSGGRFEGGVWFDSDYTCGFQGNYFFLAEKSVRFSAASGGEPGSLDLAQPYVNAVTGQPASSVLAAAGLASGAVAVQSRDDLQGGEANLVWNVRRKYPLTFDLVGGFRYLNLNGSVNTATETTALAGAAPGANTITEDLFSVHNHFYGAQVGGRVEYRWRRLVLDFTEKLALGANTADIAITGYSLQVSAAGTVTSTLTGLFAQPSNIGRHSDDSFAVVNEMDLRAGWQFCDYFQAFVGYTFLYSSSVVRPGDVVDTGLNPSQLQGGPLRPAFAPRETGETDFWAQGLNAGIEIRY